MKARQETRTRERQIVKQAARLLKLVRAAGYGVLVVGSSDRESPEGLLIVQIENTQNGHKGDNE